MVREEGEERRKLGKEGREGGGWKWDVVYTVEAI